MAFKKQQGVPEYSIAGGETGKDRLSVLTRTLERQSNPYIEKSGIRTGFKCLDIGCGAGAVLFYFSELVGSTGTVTGMDIDETQINFALETKRRLGATNTDFFCRDVYQLSEQEGYDLIYSRFLLSHLNNAPLALEVIYKALKPGGILLLEDTDFSGHFSHPENRNFTNYVRWYQQLLQKRGANANRGQELLHLLTNAGFEGIDFKINQPAHSTGEGKKMAEITLGAIKESLIKENIADSNAIDYCLQALVVLRKQKNSIVSMPRIFQYKAYKPA